MIEISCEVRTINQAAEANRRGRGGGVYCTLANGGPYRVVQAKSVRGQLVVRRLDDGHWVYPVAAYKEW